MTGGTRVAQVGVERSAVKTGDEVAAVAAAGAMFENGLRRHRLRTVVSCGRRSGKTTNQKSEKNGRKESIGERAGLAPLRGMATGGWLGLNPISKEEGTQATQIKGKPPAMPLLLRVGLMQGAASAAAGC